MIKAIGTSYNNVSFGNVIQTVKDPENRDAVLAGSAVGTGATATVIKGTQGIKKLNAFADVATKGTKTMSKMGQRAARLKGIILKFLEGAEKYKILKPVAWAAKKGPVKALAGFAGGFLAIFACVTDFAGIVNTTSDLAKN